MKKIFLKLKNKDYNAEHYVVFMPKLFNYESVNFEKFKIIFNYKFDNFFGIEFESKELSKEELSKIALIFYSYLKILIGYYPKIIECSFMNLEDFPEKYKTKSSYIRDDGQYIYSVDYNKFFKSFDNFINLYDRCLQQLSIFDCSIMVCSHYSDISIVNILQALDGIFDNLSFTSSVREIVDEDTKEKLIKSVVNFKNISSIIETEEKYKKLSKEEKNNKINKLKSNFNDNLIRVNKLNFKDKLDFLFNSTIVDVFEFEKELLLDNKYYYNNLLKLFKNTRNMISHSSSEESDILNGKESIGYIYKLLLVFRLLIFKEIGLEEKIDIKKLNQDIKSMNEYLFKEEN